MHLTLPWTEVGLRPQGRAETIHTRLLASGLHSWEGSTDPIEDAHASVFCSC